LAFKIFLERKTKRQIEGLDQETKRRILESLKELEKGFSARLDIKKLKGYDNHYRIRVGNYRVMFIIESGMVYIYDVSLRGNAYK
jgi:mRNA interferase RelE/StbE